MPTYQYRCKKCDFEMEQTLRMDDRHKPIEEAHKYGTCSDLDSESCDLQIVPQFPAQISMRDGWRRHTSDGWKDRLKEIKRQTPGSNLDT